MVSGASDQPVTGGLRRKRALVDVLVVPGQVAPTGSVFALGYEEYRSKRVTEVGVDVSI